MWCACPDWEYAAVTYLLTLQRLQNKVLRILGNIPRCTPIRDLHTAFRLPYVTKFCMQQSEVVQDHGSERVRSIGQGETRHRRCKRLKLGGGEAYGRSNYRAAVVA
jgi:hypothetical protein